MTKTFKRGYVEKGCVHLYRVIKFDKSGLNPVEIAEMKNGSVACRAAKAYSGQTGFKSSVIKFDESEHEIKSWDYGK